MTVFVILACLLMQEPTPQSDLKPIRIRPETTYITEPLDADGNVDYVEALNQRYNRGTAETNSNAAFRQIIGMRDDEKAAGRDDYLQRLGIAPDFPNASFVTSSDFARTTAAGPAAVRDQLRAAAEKPWTTTDYSFAANWVAVNARSLEELRAALCKPDWYEPLGPPGCRVLQISTPQDTRTAVRLLSTSAMFQIGSRNKDRVWQDIIACHRLGSHVGQGATVVEGLVGYVSSFYGYQAEFAFLSHIRAPGKVLDRYETELRAVKSPKSMAERWGEVERFAFLDTVCALHRGDRQEAVFGEGAKVLLGIRNSGVDLNDVMEAGNAWFDKLCVRGSKPAGVERILAVEAIQAGLAKDVPDSDPVASATHTILKQLFHPNMLKAAVNAETQHIMRDRMSQVAWALRRYADKHKSYPDELSVLEETANFKVPLDPFSDKPFIYSRDLDGGCVFYSLGVNRKDDAGTEPGRGVTDYDNVVRLKK